MMWIWSPIKTLHNEWIQLQQAHKDLEEAVSEAEKSRKEAGNTIWDFLQMVVGEWGDQTFPETSEGNIRGLINHAHEELEEIATAENSEQLAEECADVVIMLMHLAYSRKFSLYQAVSDKFKKIQNRHWLPPDEYGIVRHVKEKTDANRK